MLVFARSANGPTGVLLRSLRDAVRARGPDKLFGWLVLLGQAAHPGRESLEQESYRFAVENQATFIPVSAMGNPKGPPGYRLSPQAETTILLFRGGKVLANAAYAGREWTRKAAAEALPGLLRALKGAMPGPAKTP